MLVRSQDNKKITENIHFTTVESKLRKYEIRHVDSWRLYGEYSTMEEAIEALDMLEQAYRNEVKVFQMPAEYELMGASDSNKGAICNYCGSIKTEYNRNTDSWRCESCGKEF